MYSLPLADALVQKRREDLVQDLQGYLAHKKTPTPLCPPYDPRHRPTAGS